MSDFFGLVINRFGIVFSAPVFFDEQLGFRDASMLLGIACDRSKLVTQLRVHCVVFIVSFRWYAKYPTSDSEI